MVEGENAADEEHTLLQSATVALQACIAAADDGDEGDDLLLGPLVDAFGTTLQCIVAPILGGGSVFAAVQKQCQQDMSMGAPRPSPHPPALPHPGISPQHHPDITPPAPRHHLASPTAVSSPCLAARRPLQTDGQLTVTAALQAEAAGGMHAQSPAQLAEPSAALGLLWMRRLLGFQHAILNGLVESEEERTGRAAVANKAGGGAKDTKAIARAAYAEHYEAYHGWIVKKTFSVALSGVPPRDELFRRLAPRLKAAPPEQLEAACLRELGECEVIMRRVFESMRRSFDQLGLDDRRKA